MTPSTAPLPPNNEDTSKVSTEGVSVVTETAGSQVASNSLLMRTIFSTLEGKDLLNWMVVSREHFHLIAGILYRSVRHAHLTQLWRKGCNIKRFQTYAQAVRILMIAHECVNDEYFITLLNQYDDLAEIHCNLDYEGIQVEELYIWNNRDIIVRGCEPPDYLMEFCPVLVQEDYEIERLEIRSIGSKEQSLSEEEGEVLLEWMIYSIRHGSYHEITSLRNITGLELPFVKLDLKSLKAILIGYPELRTLRCSLDDTAPSDDEKKVYRKELKRLIAQHGAKFRELDLRFASGNLFSWLGILTSPRTLRLSGCMGTINPIFYERMSTHTHRPLQDGSIMHLILRPTDVAIGKVNPYEAAKAVRWLIPPYCTIRVENSIELAVPSTRSRLDGWIDDFRSILKTLQTEDDIERRRRNASASKGWVKVENAPGAGELRNAVRNADVKDAPDGGDVKAAPGGGEEESVSTDSGVDSTVGGGDEPSLWSESFGNTSGELSTCPTHI